MFQDQTSDAGKRDFEPAWKCYDQCNYAEAELLFRQSFQQREKVQGAEDINTLKSKSYLADTLIQLQKFAEAEQLHRQLVQQRSKVLGAEHIHTLKANTTWHSCFTGNRSSSKLRSCSSSRLSSGKRH
jgi:hypothetical protein